MKLIEENPFRILGVYSNAKPADIVSNCDDMEAYLSIGQSVSFDLDLNNLMPTVVRTTKTVSNAKTQINLPKDKLKHALFWFVKDSSSAHALNYLKNGDFDNIYEVLDMENSFASRINKAVTAILQDDDLGFAIANVTEMIHDNDDLGLRDDFVKAICGNAFSITEDELAHLYIDSLLEEVDTSELFNLFVENGVSQEDDDYIKAKLIDEPISRINAEISKAKAVKRDDAKANYIAGKTLMMNTKQDLALVKYLLGATGMKYQMLADDLASTILQCGINYYNNTDDDNDIDNAMVLQKYACKIAVGKMCKDRCDKNLVILEKKKEEKNIEDDMVAVANQLKTFQTKPSSIENAKKLINDCKPFLVSIKGQLGSQNNTYLQISSAVANNALGMIVTVINKAQDITSSPYSYSSPITDLVNLKTKIDSALNVMNMIGSLDMTSTEHNRFITNKNTLNSLKSHVNSVISSISSGSSPYGGNRGGSSGGSSGGCYIATMCYGNYDHPQVMVLRDFRDSVLLQHSWGKAFVRFYYRNSPNWVEQLKDKRLINKVIRKLLDKFIILYKHVKK